VPSVLTRRVGHKCSIEASLVRFVPQLSACGIQDM